MRNRFDDAKLPRLSPPPPPPPPPLPVNPSATPRRPARLGRRPGNDTFALASHSFDRRWRKAAIIRANSSRFSFSGFAANCQAHLSNPSKSGNEVFAKNSCNSLPYLLSVSLFYDKYIIICVRAH
jgi:hypothetical protein